MVWHEILAWAIIVVAVVVAVVWLVRVIVCPKNACAGCSKRCVLKRIKN